MIFELHSSAYYKAKVFKLTKKNQLLLKKIEKALFQLSINPSYPSLKSHKAGHPLFKEKVWASWVTDDYRIIWKFKTQNHIALLDFDTHLHVYQ